MLTRPLSAGLSLFLFCAAAHAQDAPGYGANPTLPEPDAGRAATNFSKAAAWPAEAVPKAPDGFVVTRFAEKLDHPRWLYVLPNGDVLVAESTTAPKPPKDEEERKKQELMKQSGSVAEPPNRITLLRDTDGDGIAETQTRFLDGLKQPFGMALVGDTLFVGNTDGVMRFPYRPGEQRIEAKGDKILDLPAGGYNNHWTRNILPSRDGTRLFVTVGSASNAAEHGIDEEKRRANILEVNLDGSGERIFASGLRNPNGLDFEPSTGELWTAVNERDMLGDDLVPDYITSVKEGGFYGWPYSYWGRNLDPRIEEQHPDLVARAIVPDYGLGNHTASLGLAFYKADAFPPKYRGGAFVGQRGSWNRSEFAGYKVVFVPFENGKPSGPPEDFLTGFMPNPAAGIAYGRPVGVAVDKAGALLVADEVGDIVWRVAPRPTSAP